MKEDGKCMNWTGISGNNWKNDLIVKLSKFEDLWPHKTLNIYQTFTNFVSN